MADDKKAPAAADKGDGEKKKAGGGNPLVTLVGVPLLTVVGLAAAAWFGGPAFAARMKPQEPRHKVEHPAEEEEAEHKGGEHAEGELVEINNLIVDLRDESGMQRHLKLGVAVELKPEPGGGGEHGGGGAGKRVAPFAKDAMLEYLRALNYDYVIAPQNFPEVKKQITDRIVTQVGKSKVKRVLVTDFIVQ
jgi:flagellar basal body-associated protein FliL